MSRTFVLPVTGDLTNPNDGLPPELTMRESARDLAGAARAITRVYYPYRYDPLTNTYGQASQEITDLGVIDVVELWERTSESPTTPQNAPDDFIVNLSIASLTPDANARALVTVVDAVGAVRYPSFLLPVDAGAEEPVPGQPNYTKYGIPLWSGDRIVVEWQTPPASPGALIVLNVAPADGVNLAKLTAEFIAGCGCADAECPECVQGPDPGRITGSAEGTQVLTRNSIVTYTVDGYDFEADDEWSFENVTFLGPSAAAVTINTATWIDANTFELELDVADAPGFARLICNRAGNTSARGSIIAAIVSPA